jgi:hypothetical protein
MWQAAAGMGMGAAGSVLNSIGEAKGFRALAAAKRAQMAEQDALQEEDRKDFSATMQNNNPWLTANRNEAQAIQPGQQYLESVRNIGPVGLSVSQQVAGAQQQEGNMADVYAANDRLARLNAANQTQTGLRLSKNEFADRRGGRESRGKRMASLYDLLDMQAAQSGEGMRNLGNMLIAGGSAVGGMGGGKKKKGASDPSTEELDNYPD